MQYSNISSLLLVLAACEASSAQGLTASPGTPQRSIVGATGGLRLPNQAPRPGSQNSAFPVNQFSASGVKLHLDPLGKPCVAVSAFSRPQLSRNIFEQTKPAENPQTNNPSLFE